MRTLAFVQAHLNQRVTAPGGIGGQCVDLANLYMQDVLQQPLVRLNAVDWRTAKISGMVWTPNSPVNSPPPDSIVIWGPNAAAGTGQYGHIAIALAADSMTLLTFDQDWPYGAPCSLTLHTYDGVLGWHQLAVL